MLIFFQIVLLVCIFAVLGIGADLAVRNIKYLASIVKMRLFALGILLGIITTLPELSVGINATIEGVASVSVGNILGGIIVIIGLIIGISLVLNRRIDTDGNRKALLPTAALILTPLILGADGRYGIADGLIIIALYVGLVYYLWRINKSFNLEQIAFIDKRRITRSFFLAVAGVITVMQASHWIVQITVEMLENTAISKLAIGLLIFSIGTNLPEITIALTSWKQKASQLSLSHLISSAYTNVLILGLLAVMKPIDFKVNGTYFIITVFLVLIVGLFLYFSHSQKRLDRREGYVLFSVYILFLLSNIVWTVV